MPRLEPATVEALKQTLPAYASLDNPVDVTAHVLRDLSLWPKTAEALLADPGIGSLCIPMVAGSQKYAMDKFNALAPALARHDKPAVIALLGDDFPVPPEFPRGVSRGRACRCCVRPSARCARSAHATAYGQALGETQPARRLQRSRLPCPGAERCPSIRARTIWRRSAFRCRKARSRATWPRRTRSRSASAIRSRSRRRRPRSRTRAMPAGSHSASRMRARSKPRGRKCSSA